MTPIFIDIEVLQHDPPPWMLLSRDDVKVPKNYTRPETITNYVERKLAEQEQELRAASSLMPNGPLLGGAVCAVGIAIGEHPTKVLVAPTGDEAGEENLLARLERGLEGRDLDAFHLVTFGGRDYDLPFLTKRALRHGLATLSRWCFQPKRYDRRFVDLLQIWRLEDRSTRGTLKQVAAWLGIEVLDAVRGGDVQALWEAGAEVEVGADVELIRQVYWRFREAGLMPDLPTHEPKLTATAIDEVTDGP